MSRQENNIENDFIRKLEELGYQYRPDIKDNITLNQNFRPNLTILESCIQDSLLPPMVLVCHATSDVVRRIFYRQTNYHTLH
jgi:hypothetical protein